MDYLPTSLPTGAAAAHSPYGVLLVDDQQVVREGLSRLIACAPEELRCVGTAASASQAMAAVRLLRPDVVVLDVDLAGEDGLSLLPELLPLSRVLVLTCHGDGGTRERALRLGAHAFLEKHCPAVELLGALLRLGRIGGEATPPRAAAGQGPSSPMEMAPSSAVRRPTEN